MYDINIYTIQKSNKQHIKLLLIFLNFIKKTVKKIWVNSAQPRLT